MTLNPPQEGDGLHSWLLTNSRRLLVAGNPRNTVIELLQDATVNCNRTTQDVLTEIVNAVDGAEEFLANNPSYREGGLKKGSWKDPYDWYADRDTMSRIDRRAPRLAVNKSKQQMAISKGVGRIVPGGGEQFSFYKLFGGIDFSIAATTELTYPAIIKCISEYSPKELASMQYIVPNYFYDTDERADFNIGERLFVVIEFDKIDKDSQWYLLGYLAEYTSFYLVMIVDSGGKSLHGWFACYGYGEHRVRTLGRLATELGADKTTDSPSQWVRMPNGWNRKYNQRQEVIYFDYEALSSQHSLCRRELI
jgi:hypothetical protein